MGYPATWTPEDRERGLTALVLAGSSTIAEKECEIPATTLRDWKSKYPEQYERLCNDLESRVVQKIAAEAEGIVLSIADRERVLIESLTDAEIQGLDAKDKASTLRNLSTSKALQIDKLSSPLRERPSHVQGGMDMEGLMLRMERALGIQHVPNEAAIDSTALSLSTVSDEANAPELDHVDQASRTT